jgi:hypothetical protein
MTWSWNCFSLIGQASLMPVPVGFPHVDNFLGRLDLISGRRPQLQMLFQEQVVVAG